MTRRGRDRSLPFVPRSNAYLERGDYWAIPTRRGGWYCAAAVLWPGRGSGSRVTFGIGLLDWCGPQVPTPDDLDGVQVLTFGFAHVKTVADSGGHLLGTARVVGGPSDDEFARAARFEWPEVRNIPTWGRGTVVGSVHQQFGRHFPEHPLVAVERPWALRQGGDA